MLYKKRAINIVSSMNKKLKKIISESLHENFYSYIENYKNRYVIHSLNSLLDINKKKAFSFKRLLIDGSFYNLGYFYRLQLLRSLIKTNYLEERGYIWNYNKKICKNILKKIGISKIHWMDDFKNGDIYLEAKLIYEKISHPSDILTYEFPEGMPGAHLYDVILKRQRSNTVNIDDVNLIDYIYEYLCSIYLSKKLLIEFNPDIVALSHGHSIQCGPMAHLATKAGIKTLILFGGFGVPRFLNFKTIDDLYFGIPHPPRKDLESIEDSRIVSFQEIGANYLRNRIKGKFKDLDFGGRLAYGKNKKKLDLISEKDINKKVIAVYISNWFDVPHLFGMNRFLDILEWTKATIEEASKNKDVIWLIKPHPAEEWYAGPSLQESLAIDFPDNIILLPNNYSGKSVMESSDALVTFHGTSAIEFAASGKPVLVADKGWYHDCDFVLFPESREDYLKILKTNWYENINIERTKEKARLFAGVYFGMTSWQGKAILPDDVDKEKIRKILPKFVKKYKSTIKKEIQNIKGWIENGSIDYHTYKNIKAKKNRVQKDISFK